MERFCEGGGKMRIKRGWYIPHPVSSTSNQRRNWPPGSVILVPAGSWLGLV
jgi:hypothetical protein